ncbi:MAG TPA: hypothetical protein PKA64_17960, partial [Myxococcota bacterium]|nr:hypothetical protein [Myxococcota bacterium]
MPTQAAKRRRWTMILVPHPPGRRTLMVADLDAGDLLAAVEVDGTITEIRPVLDHLSTQRGAPTSITCADPNLASALAAHLRGVTVIVEDREDIITPVLAVGMDASAPGAPGLTHDLPDWRAALTELIRCAPWSRLTDDVVIYLSGGPVDGARAQVLGARGEIRSVVLYASDADLHDVRAARMADHLTIMVEPTGDQSERHRDTCRRLGLDLPGPYWPDAASIRAGGVTRPSPEEQRRLRVAVLAVNALMKAGGDAATLQLDGQTITITTDTPPRHIEDLGGGRLAVVPDAVPARSAHAQGAMTTAVIVALRGPTLTKGRAVAEAMTDLLLREEGPHVAVIARAASRWLGKLGHISPSEAARLPSGEDVGVVVVDKRDPTRAPTA